MHLHAPQVLAAISGFLALSSANPLSFDAALGKLDKRGCQADCGLPNRPLARQRGQPCGGQCDQTYRLGSETCSCDLGAIVSFPAVRSLPTEYRRSPLGLLWPLCVSVNSRRPRKFAVLTLFDRSSAKISNGSLWLIALVRANAASITSLGLRPVGELATPRDGRWAVMVRGEAWVSFPRQ